MKIRTLIVCLLGVFVVSSASLAQVTEVPEQEPKEPALMQSDSPTPAQPKPSFVVKTAPTPRPQAPRPRRLNTTPLMATPLSRTPRPTSSPSLRIFELKYADVEELANMIENLFRIEVQTDYRSNRLIVNTTKEQMESIENLIQAMDVADSEASTPEDIQNLVYRIYMFEIPSEKGDMKPFSMILQVPPEVFTTQVLDAPRDGELQISGFCLSDELDRDGKAEILIQGRAASPMALKRMVVDEITESRIKELKWDDAETFTGKIAAAQFTQLTPEMQNHIAKFLGDDIRTVGYWFGNLSVPGEVEAPIGPWTLKLRLSIESDRMLELRVDVETEVEMEHVPGQPPSYRINKILSNTIRAKIGKPIIIGYNRESYGTRKMGAMVIVPEAEMIQSEEIKSNF